MRYINCKVESSCRIKTICVHGYAYTPLKSHYIQHCVFFTGTMTTLVTKVISRDKCCVHHFVSSGTSSLRSGRSKQLDLELVLQIYMMNQCLWLLLKQIQLHICSLFFIVRIGAKHQELRQKQLRGLLDYSTSPGGPDIDDDEVDPNYARVNHFREAYPAASIYRPSSPAVAETFVYPRDSASAPMEREHLEGLYAKINKQHYPQTPGDR